MAQWDKSANLFTSAAELFNAVKDRTGCWPLEIMGLGMMAFGNSMARANYVEFYRGGIGYGAAGVIGSALAGRDRGKFTVAIIGDGDFTMGPGRYGQRTL